MLRAEQDYGGWAYTEGFDEFVTQSQLELASMADDVLGDITLQTILDSVRHPNGFFVTKLRDEPEGQLRLHLWPTVRNNDILPHTHPWHLSSLVLAGTYIEFLPAVDMNPKGDYELMVPHYNESHEQDGVETTGHNVGVYPIDPYRHYDAGEFHSLPAGAFHSTMMPRSEPVLTLMRTSRQFYDNPSFVQNRGAPKTGQSLATDRPNPTREEAEEIWAQIEPTLS